MTGGNFKKRCLFLSVLWWKICGFAIYGLANQQNLRICNLQFAVQSKEICGLSLRICEFKKKLLGNPLANLSLLSTVHLELRIFPRIFEQIQIGPNRILRGLGENVSWKNMKLKISWHCPFKLPFACTKLYKVKTADSRCHSWPTGNYVPELNLLKGPPPLTHTQVT